MSWCSSGELIPIVSSNDASVLSSGGIQWQVSMSRNFESQELEYEMYREPWFWQQGTAGCKFLHKWPVQRCVCLSQERRASLHFFWQSTGKQSCSAEPDLFGLKIRFFPTLDFLLGEFLLSHLQIQQFSVTPVKWTQSLGWFVITESSTLKYMLFECS